MMKPQDAQVSLSMSSVMVRSAACEALARASVAMPAMKPRNGIVIVRISSTRSNLEKHWCHIRERHGGRDEHGGHPQRTTYDPIGHRPRAIERLARPRPQPKPVKSEG